MISSLLTICLMTSLPEGLLSLDSLIDQSASQQSDPAMRTLATERLIAASEIQANINALAKAHQIPRSNTQKMPSESLKALASKVSVRLPLEATQRILAQLENSDEVVQLMGTRRLLEISPKADLPNSPEELALRSIYQRDLFQAMEQIYLRSFEVRPALIRAKKKKDLEIQVLQQIEEQIQLSSR